MKLICAVDESWAIGKNNGLLYSVPEDMKFFREKTINKTVIYGRKTLESFPNSKPLPKRRNIVISTSISSDNEELTVVRSSDELFEVLKNIPEDDIYICGGSSVYKQFYKLCDELYITKIYKTTPDASSFFPNIDDDSDFKLTYKSEILTSVSGIKYQFLTYTNKKTVR